jgi:hypothetical protein
VLALMPSMLLTVIMRPKSPMALGVPLELP